SCTPSSLSSFSCSCLSQFLSPPASSRSLTSLNTASGNAPSSTSIRISLYHNSSSPGLYSYLGYSCASILLPSSSSPYFSLISFSHAVYSSIARNCTCNHCSCILAASGSRRKRCSIIIGRSLCCNVLLSIPWLSVNCFSNSVLFFASSSSLSLRRLYRNPINV